MVSLIFNWLPIFVVLLLISLFVVYSLIGVNQPSYSFVGTVLPMPTASTKSPLQW